MSKRILLAASAAIAFLSSCASTLASQRYVPPDWRVGYEYEFQPGYHSALLADQDGWMTINTESGNRTECYTIKPAIGYKLERPFQGTFITDREIYVIIRNSGDGSLTGWNIDGPHTGQYKYRKRGSRFFEDGSFLNRDTSLDGEIVQFDYRSWEYPAIRVGGFVATGEADFAGLEAAIERHKSLCIGQ